MLTFLSQIGGTRQYNSTSFLYGENYGEKQWLLISVAGLQESVELGRYTQYNSSMAKLSGFFPPK